MYSKDYLEKNDFFKKYIDEDVLDSLTKVISRKYILLYIKYLIEQKIPFAMAILDLDNFKNINDYYGHVIGDKVLSTVGMDLAEYIGEAGFVGRYGGDEFIFVYLKGTSYDDVYSLITEMYNKKNVLRRNINLGKIEPFVTGTTGSASFPINATTYDDLFMKADKALYRGKTKGRNCFIVYVEEKHKDIEIFSMKKESLHIILENVSKIFEAAQNTEWKICSSLNYVVESFRISGAYYINKGMKCYSTFTNKTEEMKAFKEKDLINLLGEKKIFASSDLPFINSISSDFYEHCKENGILSVLFREIKYCGISYGYLIFLENKINRLWQEEDLTVLTFLAKFIGISLCNK